MATKLSINNNSGIPKIIKEDILLIINLTKKYKISILQG